MSESGRYVDSEADPRVSRDHRLHQLEACAYGGLSTVDWGWGMIIVRTCPKSDEGSICVVHLRREPVDRPPEPGGWKESCEARPDSFDRGRREENRGE